MSGDFWIWSFSGDYHCIQHYGVMCQDRKTAKLRTVYDGLVKAMDEYSFDNCLLTGPNSILKLFNILIQFRWNPVAITAYTEKAFPMISIKLSDCNFLCFLWIKDTFAKSELIHLCFTCLAFRNISSCFGNCT